MMMLTSGMVCHWSSCLLADDSFISFRGACDCRCQIGKYFGVLTARPAVHFAPITGKPSGGGLKIHHAALSRVSRNCLEFSFQVRRDIDDLVESLERRPNF